MERGPLSDMQLGTIIGLGALLVSVGAGVIYWPSGVIVAGLIMAWVAKSLLAQRALEERRLREMRERAAQQEKALEDRRKAREAKLPADPKPAADATEGKASCRIPVGTRPTSPPSS